MGVPRFIRKEVRVAKYRRPRAAQMEILDRIIRDAVIAANKGFDTSSARVAVRKRLDTIGISMAELSRRSGVSKGVLNTMLSYHGGRACYRARRAVEPHLGLPPGGLGMVLAIVEDMA